MSARDFFTPDAKASVASAIAGVEQQTSAEVVIAVRAASGHYRHSDYLAGLILAAAGLCVFIFHPSPFRPDVFPLEMGVLFIVGSLLSSRLPPLRRLLSSHALMERSVRTEARAAFVELGVSRTKGRCGLLVFVSMLERRVEVVTDIGIDQEALGRPWRTVLDKLNHAIQRDVRIDAFVAALGALGPILAASLPRANDDMDELPNEVRA